MTERSERPARRVGTFTFGLVLLAAGTVMLISLFLPALDLTWMLGGSPLLLISLGVEVLLAAKDGGPVKYDWVGMVLCGLIVCTAVGLYLLAWILVHYPDCFFL